MRKSSGPTSATRKNATGRRTGNWACLSAEVRSVAAFRRQNGKSLWASYASHRLVLVFDCRIIPAPDIWSLQPCCPYVVFLMECQGYLHNTLCRANMTVVIVCPMRYDLPIPHTDAEALCIAFNVFCRLIAHNMLYGDVESTFPQTV